MKYYDKENI